MSILFSFGACIRYCSRRGGLLARRDWEVAVVGVITMIKAQAVMAVVLRKETIITMPKLMSLHEKGYRNCGKQMPILLIKYMIMVVVA